MAEEQGPDWTSVSWLDFRPAAHSEIVNQQVASFRDDLFALHGDTRVSVYPSPSPLHYRSRVKFSFHRSKRDGQLYYLLHDKPNGSLLDVETFPLAHPFINEAMVALLSWFRARDDGSVLDLTRTSGEELSDGTGKDKGEQKCEESTDSHTPHGNAIHGLRGVGFLSRVAGGSVVISLFYNVTLETAGVSTELLVQLKSFLAEKLNVPLSDVHIVARARGARLELDRDWLMETYILPSTGQSLLYKHTAGSFSNPNPHIAVSTLEWLVKVLASTSNSATVAGPVKHSKVEEEKGVEESIGIEGGDNGPRDSSSSGGDLLELFSGCGNHTVALAPFFHRVVAVEINKVLCAAAEENLKRNKVTNAIVYAEDAQKFCKRELALKEYNFSACLVDPPRAGLDDDSRQLVALFPRIAYISCCPESLKRDLDAGLSETHEVAEFAFLDHFPMTSHAEVAVLLRAKSCV